MTRTVNLRAQGDPTVLASETLNTSATLSPYSFLPSAHVPSGQTIELEFTDGPVSLTQLLGSVRATAAAGANPFGNVPILPGMFQYDFVDAAYARISALPNIPVDDPIDWASAMQNANRVVLVTNNIETQAAINNLQPGDYIAQRNGNYVDPSFVVAQGGLANARAFIGPETPGNVDINYMGGVTAFRFENGADNITIGGANFIGTSETAIDLRNGPGEHLGALSTQLPGAEDVRITDSHFQGIGVARANASATISIGARCNRTRLDHCSFYENYSQPRINSSRNNGLHILGTKDCRVDHNYFGPSATSGS